MKAGLQSSPLDTGLILTSAADIEIKAVQWLWPGWLAVGKPHILGGAPGTGKTTLAMAMAATVSSGGRWPDGLQCRQGRVLVWSGEDDPADSLVPRLKVMGADLTRIEIVSGLRDGTGVVRAFDPATDIAALTDAFNAFDDITMFIIDPLVSAVSGDSHRNTEVRRNLQPLVDMAQANDCALLGITHFSKGMQGRDAIERINGSIAFTAVPRIVMVAAQHLDGEGAPTRLLARAKSNIGPDGGGFAYEIHQLPVQGHAELNASCVLWKEPVEGTANQLLGRAEQRSSEGSTSALQEATEWLADFLADGPKDNEEIRAAARSAGHTVATVKRAKADLKVKSQKQGMDGGWAWVLPEGAQGRAKELTEHDELLRQI